jgi:tRNA pseudouridine synthase 10
MKALKEIATQYPICDECIGRLFPYIEGENNRERGKKVRELLGIKESRECYFCRGIFNRLDDVARNLDVHQYEFNTFILGTHLDEELLKREEMLLERVGVVDGIESLKKNLIE